MSKATASLALNNNPRISEPTRQRVLEAVESLGYVYNQRAASLRTQRSYTIGLIIKDVSNPFNAELTSGAESQLADHDYQPGAWLQRMTTLWANSLVWSRRCWSAMWMACCWRRPQVRTTASLQRLMDYCPLVLLTPYYADLAADCVGMDDEKGTARAVEHLIQQGHRRIAFVGGFETELTRQRRLQSYRETLQRHNIEFDPALRVAGPVSRRGGYDAIHQLLSMSAPPSAAYCYSDVIAFGMMLGLRAAGLEAGKDFAVIGFDDVPEASLWHP